MDQINQNKNIDYNTDTSTGTEKQRWSNIASILWKNRNDIQELLTDETCRVRLQFLCVFVIFFAVSALMTVVNVITQWHLLMLSTLVFAVLSLINVVLTLIGPKTEFLARVLFAVEIVLLFVFFAIMGEPEGFSAIWIALLPACGLLLYRLKYGIILSTVQFAIIVFLFWTKLGNSLLLYDYTDSFLLRFPLLYTAFFVVGIFFEFIRQVTQTKLVKTRGEFKYLSLHDPLTGLFNRTGFSGQLVNLSQNGAERAFAIMDIDDFKKFNDQYGHNCGDEVLRQLSAAIENTVGDAGSVCRWGGEEFAVIFHKGENARTCAEEVLKEVRKLRFNFAGKSIPVTISIGLVEFEAVSGLNISSIISVADENLYSVKTHGKNNLLASVYTEKTDDTPEQCAGDGVTEEQLLLAAEKALENNEFIAYYQPVYSASTGLPIAAEALVRWQSSQYGLLLPSTFISAFERNGLISRLDLKMAENVFRFLKECREEGRHTLPVSINLSRADIYSDAFLTQLEELRVQYGVPIDLVRLEVVESIAIGDKDKAMATVERLHKLGYIVELDDFGTGYSSLNLLKDINYDTLKLDMGFLTNDMSGRSSTIVGAVVRMAKWLNIPVIAEGVETREQANFLKSIGCEYIQGYFYSRPIPESSFADFLSGDSFHSIVGSTGKEELTPVSFWDYKSVDTLMFNSFVGGAAVLSCHGNGSLELLRVNEKYLHELHMNQGVNDVVGTSLTDLMTEDQIIVYRSAVQAAIQTGEEQECETWRTIHSDCCGDEQICIRSNMTVIGSTREEHLLYVMIRNVTAEKNIINENRLYERQFKNVTEQANIYYWEYDVTTKEMRPCFRCMRDLGLPPVVRNYPEPAIEKGIFPADYADMYRDWHRQIAAGVKSLEAVIPLTVGRVPFRVRYTTEFDELGRPIKAYGSATYIPPEELPKENTPEASQEI